VRDPSHVHVVDRAGDDVFDPFDLSDIDHSRVVHQTGLLKLLLFEDLVHLTAGDYLRTPRVDNLIGDAGFDAFAEFGIYLPGDALGIGLKTRILNPALHDPDIIEGCIVGKIYDGHIGQGGVVSGFADVGHADHGFPVRHEGGEVELRRRGAAREDQEKQQTGKASPLHRLLFRVDN